MTAYKGTGCIFLLLLVQGEFLLIKKVHAK